MTPLTELRSKHIAELLRNPKARRGDSEFVAEGPHLFEAALEKAPKLILYIAVTEKATRSYPALLERAEAAGIEIFSLSPKNALRITDAREPQGWFTVLRMPARPQETKGNVVIALDGVQDPGNVGTVIRTAAWFGVESIILGDGTSDPFAPKVIRSTQGAVFDASLETNADLNKRLPALREGRELIATTVGETATSVYDFDFPERCVLLFGQEGRGIRAELLEMASRQIVIPKYGSGESLNVAVSAAIVLSELRRREQNR